MFFTTLNEFKTSMIQNEVTMLKNELKLKNKLIEDLYLQLNPYLEKEKRDNESNEANRIMMEDWFNKKIAVTVDVLKNISIETKNES